MKSFCLDNLPSNLLSNLLSIYESNFKNKNRGNQNLKKTPLLVVFELEQKVSGKIFFRGK
jgi:hypothetical protein